MLTNDYSPEWFSLFLQDLDPARTEREVAFIDQHLVPGSRVLDLPCGSGRHARALAALGHRVVALDRNASLLGPPGPSLAWVCADLRALPLGRGQFDAILCLWQSFGYFDAEENADLLRRWAELVPPGGRLLLDVYHRSFFEAHQGERRRKHRDVSIRERCRMEGDRLVVELAYEDLGGGDRFEWQLFTPEDLEEMASLCGWQLRLACTGFDARQKADPGQPRIQYLFVRPAAGSLRTGSAAPTQGKVEVER